MAAKGACSTLNTTDTSAAAELEPAADAPTRDGPDDQVRYPEGVGKPVFSGTHNRDGYTGGPTADRAAQYQDQGGSNETGAAAAAAAQPASSSSTTTTTTTTGGDTGAGHASGEPSRTATSTTETAPNAFANLQPPGTFKPKGANLTEGDVPATKTFTGDVGGGHDPGRAAEARMLRGNANVSGAGGERENEDEIGGGGGGGGGGTGQFDVLGSERA